MGRSSLIRGTATSPTQYQLLPGVVKGLQQLQAHFLLFIVTNQAGIGYGYYTTDQFWANNRLGQEAVGNGNGIRVRAFPEILGFPGLPGFSGFLRLYVVIPILPLITTQQAEQEH